LPKNRKRFDRATTESNEHRVTRNSIIVAADREGGLIGTGGRVLRERVLIPCHAKILTGAVVPRCCGDIWRADMPTAEMRKLNKADKAAAVPSDLRERIEEMIEDDSSVSWDDAVWECAQKPRKKTAV
jgi:hypothetical protein